MKTTGKPLLIIAAVIIILCSCSPAYIPNKVNAPEFSNSGDLHVDLAAGLSGFDIQGGLAVTDFLGVFTNFCYGSSTSETNDNEGNHEHVIAEFGGTLYKGLTEKVFIAANLGYGKGKIDDLSYNILSVSTTTDSYFNKYIFHPYFYYKSNIANINFGVKVSKLDLFIDNIDSDDERYRDIFFEPYYEISLGYKWIKPNLQMGLSLPLNELPYNHRILIFNIGLLINLDLHK